MINQLSNRPIIFSGILFLLVTFLSSCGSDANVEESDQNTKSVPVGVETAEKTSIPQEYRFSGTVNGSRRVKISTKMMGKATHVNIDEGDRISEGEVLVRIKDNNVQAQKQQVKAKLSQARAGLENAETNFERIKALHESGSATQKEFDDMKTRYKSAQSKVEAMKSRLSEINDMLDYATLTSPFEGYVVEKRISEGDMASPGRPLLMVEDFRHMEVTASVPESQINLFTLEDTVRISIKAAGYDDLSGVVKQINPAGNRASRQFVVKVTVPMPRQEGDNIKSGMYATLHLRKGGEPTIAVPQQSVIKRGQLTGLYTVSPDEEAVLRWVRTGRSYEDRIEILSGLAEGDRYIARFEQGEMKEGKKLEIR